MRAALLLVILAVVIEGSCSLRAGQAPDRPAVYTVEQAEAGRIEVQTNSFGACTDCHAAGLTGRNGDAGEFPPLSSLREDYQTTIKNNSGRVPALVGPTFRARWANRTTKDLFREFQGRFAPSSASGLSEQTRLNLIAYILQSNGALPGTQPLTTATDVEIGALTSISVSK